MNICCECEVLHKISFSLTKRGREGVREGERERERLKERERQSINSINEPLGR
jgi:hypothetical protein